MESKEMTLRSLAINRIEGDLIENTMSSVDDSFAIIIVDDYSAKILSSYLTMTEVLNQGIFSVESISRPRQNFPNYHAVYFISPTPRSCQYIADDFQNTSKPKYSRAHIFFTHEVSDEAMSKLITSGVIKRTIACKELNLSFFASVQNVFDLGFSSGLKIFNSPADVQTNLIKAMSERLYTVIATLNIYPYIQYQSSSHLCTALCEKLEPYLQKYGKAKGLTRNGILLITDRTIDATTPLLHDYNYEAMAYDFFEIKDQTLTLNGKKYKLNDKDDLWMCYKELHIAEVFNKLTKDLEEFQKTDVSKVGDSSNLDSFEGMASALSGMSTYKLKTSQFSTHIALAEELNKKYKQNHVYDIIELEQDIVTGENESGKINNRDIFKNFTILKSKIQNQRDDLIRLLMILYTSLSIGEKDFNVLSGKLSEEEHMLFKNLSYLGIEKNSQNKTERREGLNATRDKLNNLTSKLNQQMNYSSLRSSPQLELIVEKASNFSLDISKFPIKNWDRAEFPKVAKKYGTKNLFGGGTDNQDDSEDLGTLVLFNIGGISRNEIVAIEKLKRNNMVNHNLVIGSTNLMNAQEYMNQLKDICKDGTKEINVDLLSDRPLVMSEREDVSMDDISVNVLKK